MMVKLEAKTTLLYWAATTEILKGVSQMKDNLLWNQFWRIFAETHLGIRMVYIAERDIMIPFICNFGVTSFLIDLCTLAFTWYPASKSMGICCHQRFYFCNIFLPLLVHPSPLLTHGHQNCPKLPLHLCKS